MRYRHLEKSPNNKNAEKEGHLPETALEEFTMHPFSLPALWDCRDYIWGIE